jgi:predicted RNase H-like HicB family nuclease
MKYTVMLKEENGHVQATVPSLPECVVQAPTRLEAIRTIRKAISDIISRTEIIQIDVNTKPKSGTLLQDTPWDWCGAFKNDPTWSELFDDIERRRTPYKE